MLLCVFSVKDVAVCVPCEGCCSVFGVKDVAVCVPCEGCCCVCSV